jgi:hypothetical protein
MTSHTHKKNKTARDTAYGSAPSIARAKAHKIRHQTGSSMLEMPAMLWISIIVMLMPMLSLATITLKSALMNAAVQDGVFLAAKAKTFQVGTSDKPAAMALAEGTVRGNAKKFQGLNVANVETDIIITPVAGGPPTRSPNKLTTPADTSRFIYQIETIVRGEIQPLFQVNPNIVGSIPGVSAPVLITYSAREMAENPQGLNK